MISPDDITAVILAGGQSKRMGVNKALLEVDGVTFIEKIADVCSKFFSEIVVSADAATEYEFLNLPILPDEYKNKGPIGGIYTGLKFSKRSYIFVVPCDMPFLTPEIITAFLNSAESNTISIAVTEDQSLPVFGLYPKNSIIVLEKFINKGGTKVKEFLDLYIQGYRKVNLNNYSFALRNVNTPEEYIRMLNDRM